MGEKVSSGAEHLVLEGGSSSEPHLQTGGSGPRATSVTENSWCQELSGDWDLLISNSGGGEKALPLGDPLPSSKEGGRLGSKDPSVVLGT